MITNRTVRLKQHPAPGPLGEGVFSIQDEELAELGPGEILIAHKFISLDPAMRGWVAPAKSYVEPVAQGDVMRSYSAGIVEASNHPDFATGDAVTGLLGVQTHSVSDGAGVIKVDASLAPLESWIGGLGMPGMTAYFGLLEVGEAKAGDTVVVSAASGAVGSVVGQIAKLKGARAIGIAGGGDKCAYVIDELGFDACIDYKTQDVGEALAKHCPDGIDVYFENVGGTIFDAALANMAPFGRIAVCGMISAYLATKPSPGPQNMRAVLVNRLKVQGFIIFDFAERYDEAIKALAAWYSDGKIKLRQDVREGGVDAFPETLNLLYSGGNFGKLVLKV